MSSKLTKSLGHACGIAWLEVRGKFPLYDRRYSGKWQFVLQYRGLRCWPITPNLTPFVSYGQRQGERENRLKFYLTLILLTWSIWWALNNASRWQMGLLAHHILHVSRIRVKFLLWEPKCRQTFTFISSKFLFFFYRLQSVGHIFLRMANVCAMWSFMKVPPRERRHRREGTLFPK
jgi:hypothetical protein